MSKDNKITGVYAEACSSVAEEMGTECVDLYSEMMKSEVQSGVVIVALSSCCWQVLCWGFIVGALKLYIPCWNLLYIHC